MKNLFLVVAVMVMAAGCVSGQIADGKLTAGGFGVGLRDLTDVHERTVRTDVFERNADENEEVDREIRLAEAKAEVRKVEAEARLIEAWAGRVNPADGRQLEKLLARQERLFAAFEAESGFTDESLEKKLSLWDEIQETRQLIEDFRNQHADPIGYIGGMGGLPLMSGMPMMPGMGSPIAMGGILPQGIRRDDPGLGVIDNKTRSLLFRVTLDGSQQLFVEPRTISSPVYLQPDQDHRVRIEAFTRTGGGLVPKGRVYETTVPVDSNRDPEYGYGWNAWAREQAFEE